MILKLIYELGEIRDRFKDQFIVLCHGCFDVFHYGHLTYLKSSKQLGNILVVSITDDKFINKGNGRPIFNIQYRLDIINELKCVDYCYVSNDYTAINVIRKLKPNIYTKGSDVRGKELDANENLFHETHELKLIGGKLIFIEMVPTLSSTDTIAKISV